MSTFKPTGRKTMTAEITLLQVCIRLKRGTQHTTNPLDKRGGELGRFGCWTGLRSKMTAHVPAKWVMGGLKNLNKVLAVVRCNAQK